ncbi:MAG TPA: hypothetical protein VNO55_04630, partial [Polyangia bacterium]|nr:hypothetical protein [Polyangia bacterium]
MDVRQQIAYIIDTFEGGRAERLRPGASYSDDPDDHGLETRWGISRPLLSEFLGFNVRGGVLC